MMAWRSIKRIMKKAFYLIGFVLITTFSCYAQDGQGNGSGIIREKMIEYIQDRLGLSKSEAERFTPVFIEYFRELRNTNKEFRGDPLILQQKIVDLRLRYREQFKPILGEKRSNDVFLYERDFIQKIRDIKNERLENRLDGRANKRF